MFDANRFFREATLRICSSLNMEEWLFESLTYFRRFIPVESAYLTHFAAETGTQTALAKATSGGGEALEVTVSVPESVRKHFARGPGRDVHVARRARDLMPSRPWIERGLLAADQAVLSVRLRIRRETIGAVILVGATAGCLTSEHARRVAMLREPFAIALANSIQYRQLFRLTESVSDDNRFLRAELRERAPEVVGQDMGLKQVMDLVHHVAPRVSPVLLLGETGTGKEVVASAVHQLSQRKTGPFVKVNCGAIAESLMDTELFGHEKGAFTGAITTKKGRFERADGGTLFLDEVGELKPEAQVRLLRVLEEKVIERVGGVQPVPVDTRLVAATHRDLEAMVRAGTFREDLYFRLRVFPITLPPLRERREDIPALAHHFVQKKVREMGLGDPPTIAPAGMAALMDYGWPGNVRELENAVERAVILASGPLQFEDLRAPSGVRRANDGRAPTRQSGLALDAVVREHIEAVLRLTRGRVAGEHGAATLLGVNPSTLRKKMRKLRIPFGRTARWR